MTLKSFCIVALFALLQRMLLINTSSSTDFEVHRNWMAITHSLPLSQWYQDVILSELVLWVSAFWFVKAMEKMRSAQYRTNASLLVFALVLLNGGLVMVDHVHFQYNGFLLGVFLLSVLFITTGHNVLGALVFAVSVNLKHLFAHFGPLYLVFLLRHHCRAGWLPVSSVLIRVVELGLVVVFVCAAAFFPFVAAGQFSQIISRLFPFGRGLCHAYWAPNVWVFYNIIDLALAKILPVLGLSHWVDSSVSMTGGLVGAGAGHQVLPAVSPITTVILSISFMAPALLLVWHAPRPRPLFLPALCLCGLAAFLAGYHVHEKAILMVTVPLSLLAADSEAAARVVFFLSIVADVSLFPLLFRPNQIWIRMLCTIVHLCVALALTRQFRRSSRDSFIPRLWLSQKLCLALLLYVEVHELVLHPLLFGPHRAPFIPLLLRSVACAIGVVIASLDLLLLTINIATGRGEEGGVGGGGEGGEGVEFSRRELFVEGGGKGGVNGGNHHLHHSGDIGYNNNNNNNGNYHNLGFPFSEGSGENGHEMAALLGLNASSSSSLHNNNTKSKTQQQTASSKKAPSSSSSSNSRSR